MANWVPLVFRCGVVLSACGVVSALPSGCQGGDSEGDGDAGAKRCVAFDADACTPSFPAEFDRIHAETLLPICGVAGGACHANASAAGGQGGLVIDADVDGSYATLLESRGEGDPFVVAGDVECSALLSRMNTDDEVTLMPPGATPLDEGVRCAVAQWIAEGAAR